MLLPDPEHLRNDDLDFAGNTKRAHNYIKHLETTDFNRWLSESYPSHQPSFQNIASRKWMRCFEKKADVIGDSAWPPVKTSGYKMADVVRS